MEGKSETVKATTMMGFIINECINYFLDKSLSYKILEKNQVRKTENRHILETRENIDYQDLRIDLIILIYFNINIYY